MSGGLTSTGEARGQRLSMKIGIVNASSRFNKARAEAVLAWFAILKAGGVVVATMPMLRAGEPPLRPPLMFHPPQPVTTTLAEVPDGPPRAFRWRRVEHRIVGHEGPERIAPEWWLDDPDWRSGPRDYWRVETDGGERLWLFYAHGAEMSGGWFCHGQFA